MQLVCGNSTITDEALSFILFLPLSKIYCSPTQYTPVCAQKHLTFLAPCCILSSVLSLCRCSLVVELQLPKLAVWVRFPSSAPSKSPWNQRSAGFFYPFCSHFCSHFEVKTEPGAYLLPCLAAGAHACKSTCQMRVDVRKHCL